MTDDSNPVIAYAGPLIPAQQAWSILRGHGIDAHLLGQNSASAYAFSDVQVVVSAARAEDAQRVLEESGLVEGQRDA